VKISIINFTINLPLYNSQIIINKYSYGGHTDVSTFMDFREKKYLLKFYKDEILSDNTQWY
jgi:hypothetical protein